MASQPPVKILLVEDSEVDALLLQTHLEGEGLAFELVRVEEMEPLRSALSTGTWDLLLTDFALPTMDGLDVLKEARGLAPSLPCIVVSGRIGEEAAVEALRAGAKDIRKQIQAGPPHASHPARVVREPDADGRGRGQE